MLFLSTGFEHTSFPDNCCADVEGLSRIFGQQVTVKLDLFHAVSRITREIKKKDLEYKQRALFNQELSQVFRQAEDTGKERKSATASVTVITKRLKDLRRHWEKTIPKEATRQISNLLLHAEIGCLR